VDQGSFDRLARILGGATDRRAGLKAALGTLLGAGGAAAALEAEARKGRGKDAGPEAGKKKRRKCKPDCGSGYECVKGECVCPTGVICGEACCRIGQVCEGDACIAEPEPVQCIPAGEPCKGVGRACCDGRVCASGQGGMTDVACYSPKTGACTTATDCVYGMACVSGRCAPPAPAGLAAPCDAAAQQLCTTPGAVCTAYTSTSAPTGTFCTLPVGAICTGDPECTCYKCSLPNDGMQGSGGSGRASENTKVCCFPQGQQCRSETQCCRGLSCVNGICANARTCTVNLTAGDPAKSYQDLKAALLAAQDNPEDATKNPVYVGTGTWVFPGDSNPGLASTLKILSKSSTTPVKIFACGDGPVAFDGGASPSFTNTTTAPVGTEWPTLAANSGHGILWLDDDSGCGANCKGFEIDGIDFQNANSSRDGSSAGAITAFGPPVKLSNSTVARCKNGTGGIHTTGKLTLENVTIRQCYGNGTSQTAGALFVQEPSELNNVTIAYNGATRFLPGGVWANLNSGIELKLTGTTSITNNSPGGLMNYAGIVTCANNNAISGNTAGSTPVNCSTPYDGTFPGCSCQSTCGGLPGQQCGTGCCVSTYGACSSSYCPT